MNDAVPESPTTSEVAPNKADIRLRDADLRTLLRELQERLEQNALPVKTPSVPAVEPYVPPKVTEEPEQSSFVPEAPVSAFTGSSQQTQPLNPPSPPYVPSSLDTSAPESSPAVPPVPTPVFAVPAPPPVPEARVPFQDSSTTASQAESSGFVNGLLNKIGMGVEPTGTVAPVETAPMGSAAPPEPALTPPASAMPVQQYAEDYNPFAPLVVNPNPDETLVNY